MPKVSVIIPIYGVEKYIERCARSLFEQTLDNIEFIFVDDCTPDHSIEILKTIIGKYRLRFAEKNYSVRIEKMPTNSGLPAVRRHGLQFATGDYIIHCDSDDWVDIEMYQKMYDSAISNNADVVVCDYIVTDNQNYSKVVSSCHSTTPSKLIENCLLQRDPWSLWNKLFKRKAYSNIIFPKGAMGEDMTLTLQLLNNCNKLSYNQNPLYYYFNNTSSITKAIDKNSCIRRSEQLFANTEIILEFLKQNINSSDLTELLVPFKNSIRSVLYPLVGDKKYYNLWNNVFPGLNKLVLLSNIIPLKEKIRVILTIIHIYPRQKYRAK